MPAFSDSYFSDFRHLLHVGYGVVFENLEDIIIYTYLLHVDAICYNL